jgi:hypothetical protein
MVSLTFHTVFAALVIAIVPTLATDFNASHSKLILTTAALSALQRIRVSLPSQSIQASEAHSALISMTYARSRKTGQLSTIGMLSNRG